MTRRRSTLLLSVLLAATLGGCAGSPQKPAGGRPATAATSPSQDPLTAARKALASTPSCCNSFADFHFKRMLPDQPHRFHVGPGQPVADFNGSRSYFLTFRLPAHHKLPYRVVLKSELTGGRWLHSSYLFAPSVVLLSATFMPLANHDVDLCEYIGWTDATSGAFGSITVDNPRARYMVVYSSGNQLASSTYWEQSPTAFSADAPVKMASAGSFQIAHGPDGVLYVGLFTRRYRKPLRDAICGKQQTPSGGVLSTLRRRLLGLDSNSAP